MTRDIFKTILLLCALLCFIFAISSCGEEPRSTHPERQNIDTLAYSMPQALRVVPGTSWARWNSGDSILLNGFALMSQDAGNSKERIVTDSAVLAWLVGVLPDSLALSGYADTLRLSNDTLYISGQNYVLLSDYLDNTDAQTLSIITNTLSITGGNSVSLAAYLDNTDAQTLTFQNDSVLISGGNGVDLSSLLYTYYLNSRLVSSGDTIYEIVNVKNHGAVGDGVTDDTDSIQAALDTYHNIYIPEGTYIVSQILIDNDNQSITGSGPNSILKLKTGLGDPNKSPVRVDGPGTAGNYLTNVTLRNFAIDGSADLDANYNASSQNEGLNILQNTENLLVEGLHIYNVGPDGIDADDDNINLKIINCRVNDCGKTGMHVYGTVNSLIFGNVITNCYDVGITLNGGANLEPESSIFANNIIDSCGTGMNIVTGNNLTVRDNLIRNTTGTTLSSLNGEGIVFGELGTVTGASVINNKIYNVVDRGIKGRIALLSGNVINGALNGIGVSSTGGTFRSIIESNNISNITGTQGINVTSPVTATIRGNIIKTRGIIVTADTALIIANRVTNTSAQGISVSGDHSQVLSNVVMAAGTQAIEVASGALNSLVMGNYIDDAVDNGILLSADNSTASGNYIRSINSTGRASVNLNANNTHALYNVIESARAPLRSKSGITGFSLIGNRILSATHQSDILSVDGTIYDNLGDNSALAGIMNRTIINSVTTAQRDALTAVAGMVIFNTTIDSMQYRSSSAWRSFK